MTTSLPERLVLYDGVCVVCNDAVRWVIDRDVEGRFFYAPLQGETAEQVRSLHPIPDDLDSIIYVENGRVVWYSDAIFDIASQLPGPVAALAWLKIVPRPLRDAFYRGFATIRYRVFGQHDSCRMPTDAEEARFLP